MDPQTTMRTIEALGRRITAKNDESKALIESAANSKAEADKALAIKVINLKLEGQSITLIPALAKGDKAVADLFAKAAIAEGVLKAHYKSLDGIFEQIGSLRSMLTWMREEMGRGPAGQ